MSIATEYTRLKNAKENIKASITGKGVTVPGGTKLDDMSVLIDKIKQVDLTGDTVAPETLLSGVTAHNAEGELITGEIKLKVYKGEIVSTVSGAGSYAVIAKDSFLAEHRSDEKLTVRVEFEIEPTPYTVVKSWAQGKIGVFPIATASIHQFQLRYGSNGSHSCNTAEWKITDITTSPNTYVGRLYITEDGELRCYSNSDNYAIRPCNYIAKVEW